jgi:hypothetical protein
VKSNCGDWSFWSRTNADSFADMRDSHDAVISYGFKRGRVTVSVIENQDMFHAERITLLREDGEGQIALEQISVGSSTSMHLDNLLS